MQSETRIDTRVKINTSIAGNVTKYINLHTQESFDKKILTLSTATTTTATICGDACPLSCASAEAYKLAQCTRPQGWGS